MASSAASAPIPACALARKTAQSVSVAHYENFPVASRLIPAALRPAVVAIYAFARAADDIADEGDAPPATRLSQPVSWAAVSSGSRARAPTAGHATPERESPEIARGPNPRQD